jgi:Ca2+-binding RTX toxin-like protein
VTVTDKTESGAAVTINDGVSGNNSVSAAGDTSASKNKSLTYNTGSGTDTFTGGFENDTVSVSIAAMAGDTLTGGSGGNTLALTSAGTPNFTGVNKFSTIDLAAGNSTVTVTDELLSGGSLTINDGASGNNTVNAAGDTSASKSKTLTYNTGSGTDSFTGGFENDAVHVSAAAVGGDTLTGGSGTNTLTLTSAGTANLGGVSKFGTINLAAGNSTVTVTDTTLSGGSVTLHDGASGNNTVSALGDTSASAGKSLTYDAGSGADSFTGGFENDTIYAGTGLGTYTAGSGSDSFVFIADNLATQTLGNFQPSLDDILVYGIHASNGFDLGSADNALNPTSPTAITASIFTASASGAFTSSSQRFAYDTTNGALHYSATGSNSSESLVATLTGAPAVTASDLLFEH